MITEIKKYELFQAVEKNMLKDLIDKRDIVKEFYPKGKTMHEQGKICTGMHLLCSGKLVAYSLAANGSETMVFEFKQGDIVGANFLFAEQKKYPLNVYCLSDCSAIYISKEAVLYLLSNYGFALNFVKAISLNAQRMNKKIAIYARGSLRENLKAYFLALAIEQDSATIFLPMTKKQLANYFGVQRPSLFRELKKMKDEGLLAINNREITLLYNLAEKHVQELKNSAN